ncbi:CoA ester lyase [Streptomyces sp. AJS327]|uniref:HpcH/HpaI aldolase/citrate lyase family protein n=1 Tax=Streptomyces sp. AJS327 TaxID=2545265 RepID=UPI0015DE3E7D|nr:CoA ester lyase [Streptomyces sp. AJS327]MBA0050200.1 CoA ester lyase [Streptomyces sp. AJS327]
MRSALYVPGNRPEMLAKALQRGADAVLLDLEDSVAPAEKDAARAASAAWLSGLPPAGTTPGPEIWVRINHGPPGLTDTAAVALPAVTGLLVPKTEHVDELHAVAAELADVPGIALCPLLESAAALLAAPLLAHGPRVTRVQLGEADLRADTGIQPGEDERELLWARSQLVLASAAARLAPPLGPVSTDFRDLDALRRSTLALRRLGFGGRACVHPAQLAVVNEVFTPGERELDRARLLIARYEGAGSGAAVDDSGRMIDEAVVRQARRLLSTAPRHP